MKNHKILIVIGLVLALAMLACSIDLGNIQEDISNMVDDFDTIKATVEAIAKEFEGFPIPEKISNFQTTSSGFSFDTQISIDDAIDFYEEKMGSLGMVELNASQLTGEEFSTTYGGSEGNPQVQLVLDVLNENEVHVEVTFLTE